MARRHEPHRHLADRERLAISERLAAARGRRPEPRLHDGERLPRGEHMLMAGAGMIGMAVGDDGAGDATARIDMEAARPAIETAALHTEPAVELVRIHRAAFVEQNEYLVVETVNLLP